MRYPNYLRYLDAFGVTSIASAAFYVLLPNEARPEAHLDGLWGNFSSEMIGIWLSVRLIDWIIRSHESSTKARVRTIRSLRYIERLMQGVIEFRRPFELRQLYRELEWINSRMPSRRRHLKSDECRDIDAFYAKVDQLLAHFPGRNQLSASRTVDDLPITDEDAAHALLADLESTRHKAELNILEETDEDEGI